MTDTRWHKASTPPDTHTTVLAEYHPWMRETEPLQDHMVVYQDGHFRHYRGHGRKGSGSPYVLNWRYMTPDEYAKRRKKWEQKEKEKES